MGVRGQDREAPEDRQVNWTHVRNAGEADVWETKDRRIMADGFEEGMKLVLNPRPEFRRVTLTRWRFRIRSTLHGHTEKHTDEMEFLFIGEDQEADAMSLATAIMNAETIDGAYGMAEAHQRLREL